MNKILLDTTYVLPLFGIKIGISDNFDLKLKNLWKSGLKDHDLYLSKASLVESMYMLNREYRHLKEDTILGRFPLVLPAITYSINVELIDNFISTDISNFTNEIRFAGHKDLMDCWIAATAKSIEAIFLTEDKDLVKILKTITAFKSLKIWSWKDLIRNTGI